MSAIRIQNNNTPRKQSYEQSPYSSILEYYQINNSKDLIEIMMDSKLSENFKNKYHYHRNTETINILNRFFQFSSHQKEEQLLASKHTFQQLYLYFESKKNIQECKNILKYKIINLQIFKTHEIRKKMWILLSGALQKIQCQPSYYKNLSQYTQYPDYYQKIIRADVVRTIDIKNMQNYQNGEIKLQKILQTYAKRNPYIGYCQGLNFITHFLQMMQFKTEQIFWIISSMLEDILPMDYYTNMFGVAVDLKIMNQIIKIMSPKIFRQLQKTKVDISIFMLQWLVCLFTTCLPFYLVKLVWDLLLIDGSSVLLKVCLIVLQTFEEAIMSSSDFSQLLTLIDKHEIKIELTQEQFLKKLIKIHIDQQILNIARMVFGYQVKNQKQDLIKNESSLALKIVQRWKSTLCSIQWPICFQSLKKNKDQNQEMQVWIFRVKGAPRFIEDYFQSFKNYRSSQQIQQPQNTLMIGRIPHICDTKEYSKRLTNPIKSIQMGTYEHIINDDFAQQVVRDENEKPEMQFNSFAFYRRATDRYSYISGKIDDKIQKRKKY